MISIGTYFVLRHQSGGYMPELPKKSGGGYTHTRPTSADVCPPRLFKRKIAARIALTFWLKGVVTEIRERHYGLEGPDDSSRLEYTPDPSRRREEWTVVPVELTEAGA